MIRLAIILLSTALGAQEGRWITVEATAYCPCSLCCEGSDDGVTANGTSCETAPYGIAASPNIAMGSWVYIPSGAGYLDVSSPHERLWRVDDRGGSLRAEWRRSGITRFDLRYKSHESAKQFGRKLMMVYVASEQPAGGKQ